MSELLILNKNSASQLSTDAIILFQISIFNNLIGLKL